MRSGSPSRYTTSRAAVDDTRSPAVTMPVRLRGVRGRQGEDPSARPRATDATQLPDRFRKRELLTAEAVDEAPAPQLAPVLAAPQHAHELPPRRNPRLAFQHLAEHDPVAPEEDVGDPVEGLGGGGVVGGEARVDEAPASRVAEGVHPASQPAGPAVAANEGTKARVAVRGHVPARHELRDGVLDLGREKP